jgi:hypothetical protein
MQRFPNEVRARHPSECIVMVIGRCGIGQKLFHNRVFKSLDALQDSLIGVLKTLEGEATTAGSIVSCSWMDRYAFHFGCELEME